MPMLSKKYLAEQGVDWHSHGEKIKKISEPAYFLALQAVSLVESLSNQ